MFGKEKKAEDKKKETALKREENRKKSGVKHKKPKQKQAGNGNLSCLFGNYRISGERTQLSDV